MANRVSPTGPKAAPCWKPCFPTEPHNPHPDPIIMVTKKPKGLGLGLEALLGPKVGEAPAAAIKEGAPSSLQLQALQPGKYQPRTRMDEGSLYELAESIKAQGIMQPI